MKVETIVGYSFAVALTIGFLVYATAYLTGYDDCTTRGGAWVESPIWYECVERRR